MQIGGQKGIRTLETLARLLPFQGSAFNHSATCPVSLERAVGFEPTTFCMASRNSTTELYPHI
jgi:hypothetical protein